MVGVLVTTGSLLLASTATMAANESTYEVPADNAGALLCTYNQTDIARLDAYSSAYIVGGHSGKVGCSNARILFVGARQSECQVRVLLSNATPQDLVNEANFVGLANVISGSIKSVVSGTAFYASNDTTKKLCDSTVTGIMNVFAISGINTVPGGSCRIVSKSGSLSKC